MATEGARSETFLYADDLAAIQAIGRRSEKGMACSVTIAGAVVVVVVVGSGGEDGVCLYF